MEELVMTKEERAIILKTHLVTLCCTCDYQTGCKVGKKEKSCVDCKDWDNCWVDLFDFKDITPTHTYCESCFIEIMQKIRERRHNEANAKML
jgi:hypothetical protein